MEGGVLMTKKVRELFVLVFIILSFALILTSLAMQKYLYDIQVNERLSKVEDYEDYSVMLKLQKRDKRHKYLTLDNDTYYLDGVEEVYIKYGSTVAFLSDVLEKKYLSIDDLIKNMKEVNTTSDDDTFYFHKPNKNNEGYIIEIINNNDKRDIIVYHYENKILPGLLD